MTELSQSMVSFRAASVDMLVAIDLLKGELAGMFDLRDRTLGEKVHEALRFRHEAYSEVEAAMEPGDVLVMYTDGVTEAMDADREQFDDGRLQAVVAAHAGASAQVVLQAIVEAVQDFRGETPPSDDLTLCVVRRLP